MERLWMHCLLILTVLVSGNRAQATTPQSATRNRDECAVVDGLVVDGRIVLDSAALNPAEGRNVQQVLDCLPEHATVVIRVSDLRWESVLEIKKPVTLLGEGTSIQCPSEKNWNAIQIRSDNVTLSELRFVGCELENEMALIDVKNSDDVTLMGLYFESNTNRNGSACISVGNSTLHLSNITARSNVGTHGGVVSVINGSAVVLDKSEMNSNRGLDDGGAVGIYNAKMSISECRFKGNQARDGGAISVEGDVGAEIIIRDSEFIGGPVPGGSPTNFTVNARLGGAIELIGPEVNATIYNNTFHRNSALIQGGSIFSQNALFVTITETTFLHSSAGQGGSIFLSQNEQNGTAAVKIRDSVFRDNFAISGVIVEEKEVIPVGGAARFVNLTNVSIVNSSFTGNNGMYGGGLAEEGCAVLEVNNSVFSENKAVREWEDGVTVPAGGAMLLVNGTSLSTSLFSDGFYYDTTSFSGLASGGAIHLSGSVKNCSITASNFVENRAELGGAVDLFEVIGGGVEISGSMFSNNHAVEGGGALIFQHVPLSVEILASNFINNTVAFRAGGGIVAHDASMSVKSSTFTSNAVENGSGGAMYFTGSMNATVEATTLISNSAAMGGAIFVDQKADFLLRNSTCELNTAKYGGGALYAQNWGVRNRFAYEEDSNFHVVGSNFVGNEASWNFEGSDDLGIPGRGGALMIEGRGVQVYLGGCSFSSNVAGIGGAAYLEQVEDTNVEACEFISNAALTGGAVSFRTSTWLRSFSFNCTESTFANNIAREGGAFSYTGINIDSVRNRTPAPLVTSYAYFINDTFVNNTASEGGGAFDVSERDVFFGLCFFAPTMRGVCMDLGKGVASG
ncbi:hypothetical protein BSKO_05568 [Bryopsis sp. KO-2023]|nr:hypothetical protein BSKO_05568 [Bryopsis sp. KO-2023]